MQLKNKFYFLLLIAFLLLLTGCTPKDYSVKYYLEGELFKEVTVYEGDLIEDLEVPTRRNCIFTGWYTDNAYETKYDFNDAISSELNLYGGYLSGYLTFNFYSGTEIIETVIVKEGNTMEKVPTPTKENYIFEGWYTDESFTKLYNFDDILFSSDDAYAKWSIDPNAIYEINYVMPEFTWINKDALYEDFYGDFYDFLVNNTDCDMSNFETLESFLVYCKTWKVGKKDSLYHTGDSFGKYYVTIEVGGKLENQPTDTFIGYCYQNDQYKDVINHLITFFAYWRTDEGYTNDTNNGNDFFASAWASMVDTSKFFYFTSETLNDIYAWFNSERVKHALDFIPGVNISKIDTFGFKTEDYQLPDTLVVEGYKFEGFYLDSSFTKPVDTITPDMVNNQEVTIYVKLSK